VFKAYHRRMERVVALKMLPAAMARMPEAVKRFQREAKAAAKLSHPNIVTAHDADEAGGVHFLVMEYVEGQDLGALVKERGPLSVATAVDCRAKTARSRDWDLLSRFCSSRSRGKGQSALRLDGRSKKVASPLVDIGGRHGGQRFLEVFRGRFGDGCSHRQHHPREPTLALLSFQPFAFADQRFKAFTAAKQTFIGLGQARLLFHKS